MLALYSIPSVVRCTLGRWAVQLTQGWSGTSNISV
jgi:hypothetical protein